MCSIEPILNPNLNPGICIYVVARPSLNLQFPLSSWCSPPRSKWSPVWVVFQDGRILCKLHLKIHDRTDNGYSTAYLDIHFAVDNTRTLKTMLYDMTIFKFHYITICLRYLTYLFLCCHRLCIIVRFLTVSNSIKLVLILHIEIVYMYTYQYWLDLQSY